VGRVLGEAYLEDEKAFRTATVETADASHAVKQRMLGTGYALRVRR
jgi:hypothetical protein